MRFRKSSSDNTSSISLLVCPEMFDIGFGSVTLEHMFQKLAQRFVRDGESPFTSDQFNFSYSLCYRRDCLEALNRNYGPDLEEARKISVLTDLVQGQAHAWGFLLMVGPKEEDKD